MAAESTLLSETARSIVLCACLTLITPALAGTPTPAPPLAELVQTHGYVYVNEPPHVGATTNLFLSNDHNVDLKVQAVGDRRNFVLAPRKDAGTTAFGLWLPAGEYKFVSWGTHDWGDYPSFKVDAGRITNLGTLIPVAIGANQFVMLPVRRNDTPDRVTDAIDEFKAQLASAVPIEWTPRVVPKPMAMSSSGPASLGLVADLILEFDRRANKPPLNEQLRAATSIDDFISLAKSAMPPSCPFAATDDQSRMYFCAGFGQVRVRDANGVWSSLDTGTWESTTAVAWSHSAIYAGAADGRVRASEDGGLHWQTVHTFEDHDPVVSIVHAGGRWLVVTLHAEKWNELAKQMIPDGLTVHASKGDDFSDFSIVRKVELSGPAATSFWKGPTPQAFGAYYYLGTGKELLRMDLRTNEWSAMPIPVNFHSFSIAPATGTMTAYLAMGLFSKVVVSNDLGGTWTKREAPSLVINDVYFDDQVGQADRANPGTFTVTLERYAYDVAAHRWLRKQELPAGCARILHTPDRKESFCVTNGGSILHESEGAWHAEFAVQ